MEVNNNHKSVDTMLKELEDIFNSHYLNYKKYNEPYEEIISQIKVYKNAQKKDDLLIAIQNKFDSKETFLNLESNTWGILFAILGLFATMCSDLILSNYDELTYFNDIPKLYYVNFTVIFISILVILYCLSTRQIRKKSKERCYYKFVYEIFKN